MIRHLDASVQSALFADDPQAAVTALVKAYAAQMAAELLARQIYVHRIAGSQTEVECLHLDDVRATLEEWGAT